MDDLRYVFQHPEEYWPILVMLGVLQGLNLLLLVMGVLSLFGTWRAPSRRVTRRLVLACVPAFIGGLLVFCAHIPLQLEFGNRTRQWDFDLRWSFLLPLLVGGLALAAWFARRRKESDAV